MQTSNQRSQGDNEVSLVRFFSVGNNGRARMELSLQRAHFHKASGWGRTVGTAIRRNCCINPAWRWVLPVLRDAQILPLVQSSTGAIRRGFQQEGWNVETQCHWSSKSPSSWVSSLDAVNHWLISGGQRASVTDGEAAGSCPEMEAVAGGLHWGRASWDLLQKLQEAQLKKPITNWKHVRKDAGGILMLDLA